MPYVQTSWVDGTTALNQSHLNNLESQYTEAMQSFNQDLFSAFVESGLVASRHNSYASNVLGSTPLRYYRLGEASGTTAIDSSGNGQTGTYSGTFTLAQTGLLTGDPATSVLGSASFKATCPGAGLPSGNNPWSYVVWFKTPASYSGAPAVMGVGGSNTSKAASSMWTDTSGKLNCDVGNGIGQITSPTALSSASVHMGAVTWDGTTLRLYLDGAASGTATTPGSLSIPSNPQLYVGANANGVANWTGNVQEAAFFGTALSAATITALYSAGTTATTQVDLSSGVIVATQSDSTTRRRAISSASFTTVTPSTTYYLYAQPDGTTYWNTANTPAANSLAIAQVTTDGSGNVKLVTDMRTLAATLLPNAAGGVSFPAIGGQAAAGSFGVPVTVAQALRVHVTSTAQQTILRYVPSAPGLYEILSYIYIGSSGSARTITLWAWWYDPDYGSQIVPFFNGNISPSPALMTSASLAAATPYNMLPVVAYATTTGPIMVTYTDASASPNDFVTVLIRRLA